MTNKKNETYLFVLDPLNYSFGVHSKFTDLTQKIEYYVYIVVLLSRVNFKENDWLWK